MSAAQQGVDELVAEYQRMRDGARDLQRQLASLSATATSQRQTVTVTVGPQGELTGLEFPSGAHKRLPPRELADLIVATAADARRQVLAEASRLLSASVPDAMAGLDVTALLEGRADVASAMPEGGRVAGPVVDYLQHGRPGRE